MFKKEVADVQHSGRLGGVVKERCALYYPYIHIRDVNWLKATLLWFQQVRRIVPDQFTLKDFKQVKEFTETSGPAGPLLDEAHLFEEPVRQAKANLQKKIEDNTAEGLVPSLAQGLVSSSSHTRVERPVSGRLFFLFRWG